MYSISNFGSAKLQHYKKECSNSECSNAIVRKLSGKVSFYNIKRKECGNLEYRNAGMQNEDIKKNFTFAL